MAAYLSGFGNEHQSEAPGYEGAIPKGITNPQLCRYGLFAEQLSGSAFTAPRHLNRRSWLYRLRPSVGHGTFDPYLNKWLQFQEATCDPSPHRWFPFERHENSDYNVDFIDGLRTLAFSDPSSADSSVAIHIYMADANMIRRAFYNSDGDFLIVPQKGTLVIRTEFGIMEVPPNDIAVIQRGMRFSVSLLLTQTDSYDHAPFARGYILEIKGGNHFELPQLGPIGANGLANARDFLTPKAALDEPKSLNETYQLINKFDNCLYMTSQKNSPFCVAAWFGNYTPFKYDLSKFVSLNSVSVDHPDPSIFTVLSCPSNGRPGTSLADFVIFPPRWECAEGTFRPPYFHRNCMTEFMGLIRGQYQAKSGRFAAGGASLHQAMTPHGPDVESYKKAIEQDTKIPSRIADGSMAFMFETCLNLKLSNWGVTNKTKDHDYVNCWAAFQDYNRTKT